MSQPPFPGYPTYSSFLPPRQQQQQQQPVPQPHLKPHPQSSNQAAATSSSQASSARVSPTTAATTSTPNPSTEDRPFCCAPSTYELFNIRRDCGVPGERLSTFFSWSEGKTVNLLDYFENSLNLGLVEVIPYGVEKSAFASFPYALLPVATVLETAMETIVESDISFPMYWVARSSRDGFRRMPYLMESRRAQA